MKIQTLFFYIISGIVLIAGGIQAGDRLPEVAGTFYPSDSLELWQMLDSLFEKAEVPEIEGTPIALISPHAGYVYSGPTAAAAYRLLENCPTIKTAILIGFKHRVNYRGIAVWTSGSWLTPLGKVPINSELAGAILKASPFMANEPVLFENEHSLETQVPFLKFARSDLSIVPLQMGAQEENVIEKLVQSLYDVLKDRRDFIIIASSDMTHYLSRTECAAIDSITVGYIAGMDGWGLWKASENGRAQLCGAGPVVVALLLAQKLGAQDVRILKQADSGDYGGNIDAVVSYLSALVYKSDTGRNSIRGSGSDYLSKEERKLLLNIARASIEARVNNLPPPVFEVADGILKREGAAFVTITIDQNLRGCIGFTEPILPLYETVSTCAVKAASEDPRFPPLTLEEYPLIELEISVLTPLEKITDINLIEVGRHGLMLQKGLNRGLLLPQVAGEYGWNREMFLNQTCRKAGLPADCWKSGCEIYIFSAEVFGEE